MHFTSPYFQNRPESNSRQAKVLILYYYTLSMKPSKIARMMAGIVVWWWYIYAMRMMRKHRPDTLRDQWPLAEPLIVTPSSLKLLYDPGGHTLSQRGADYDCDAVINAGYFGYDKNGKYIPAWLREMWDDVRPHSNPSDPNLTYIISLVNGENIAMAEPRPNQFIKTKKGEGASPVVRFSAGPLLVDDSGNINPDLTKPISHWNDTYPRTVAIIDVGVKMSLAIFPQPITLPDTAKRITEHHTGFNRAINLDGWPSTAYRSRSHPANNFRPETTLPLVFCLKD